VSGAMTRGFRWRRCLALSRKESFQIVRDPSSILIAFVLPMILIVIYGFAVNLDSNKIRIGLVFEDKSVEAQRFADAFSGSSYVQVVRSQSRAGMEEQLKAGAVRGFVVIQPDFSARLNRPGDAAPVQVVTDGTEPNTAQFVASYAQGIWAEWLVARAAEHGLQAFPTIDVKVRYWFNPATISRNFMLPGSIAVIMTIVGALLTSLVVAREWERGTMEALLSTPATSAEILLSKLIPYYLLGMLSMLVCFVLAVVGLSVPFRGSFALLLFATSLFLGSALGLGLLLSTLLRDQFNAAQGALNAAFLPATMLSGFLFEINSMPDWVRAVTYLIPARYFVTTMQSLFQAGVIWSLLARDLLFLFVSAVFFLGLTALNTKRRLD
jgi:ABC-2 type transport system permease protein